ncbi:MAG TPA: hypothetical protein VF796_16860 [Humisphaera sp.]
MGWFAAAAAGLLFASPALAVKPYTLVEDGYPEPKGTVELENTFETTWHPRAATSDKSFSLETELEFQPTDKFALRFKEAIAYEDTADFTGLHFDAAGIEVQYYFTNPITDPLGVSVIGAAEVGERGLGAFEAILVLQKDWDKLTVTYNIGAVTEIENLYRGGSRETSGTLVNSLGAVYSVSKQVRVGGEVSVESGFAEWRSYTGATAYAGPCIFWTPTKDLWITAGVDYQITGHRDEPQYRAAIIAGYYF